MERNTLVPPQREGNVVDVEHSITALSEREARDLFERSARRLLNVNFWHELVGPRSSVFQLTDEDGRDIHREVRENDYFKINIPGPGPVEGEGFDWVKVERLERQKEGEIERVFMCIRLVRQKDGIAHFFTEEGTSTFMVLRQGLTIIAGVDGRNELSNTSVNHVLDKIRNKTAAAGATPGASRVQWENLVKGILETRAE